MGASPHCPQLPPSRRSQPPGDGHPKAHASAARHSAAQALLTSAVFLLSIHRGEGGLSPADVLMITLAGGGVIGWIIADEPVIATACVVAADLIGVAMMVPKTYRDPGSETLATFTLASLSGALAAGAVGAPDPSLLLYPVYYCLANGAIAVLIHHRRRLIRDREITCQRASATMDPDVHGQPPPAPRH